MPRWNTAPRRPTGLWCLTNWKNKEECFSTATQNDGKLLREVVNWPSRDTSGRSRRTWRIKSTSWGNNIYWFALNRSRGIDLLEVLRGTSPLWSSVSCNRPPVSWQRTTEQKRLRSSQSRGSENSSAVHVFVLFLSKLFKSVMHVDRAPRRAHGSRKNAQEQNNHFLQHQVGSLLCTKKPPQKQHSRKTMARVCGWVFLAKTTFLTRQKHRRPRSCELNSHAALEPLCKAGSVILKCRFTASHAVRQSHMCTHGPPCSIQSGALTKTNHLSSQFNKEASNSRKI